MSDGIDESVVLFVAAYFSNQEGGIEYQAGNYQGEKDYAKNEQGNFAGVQQNPTDVQRHGNRDETSPERYEEGDGFATTTNGHVGIVSLDGGQRKERGTV